MASKSISAIEKSRQTLYKSMSPAAQELADDFLSRLGKGAKGYVLIYYDIGQRIGVALKEPDTYGKEVAKQLAEYLSLPRGVNTLYNLRNFAAAFERPFVVEYSDKPLNDGSFMYPGHWFGLAKAAQEDRAGLLKKVIEKSLTVGELEMEIRSSGNTKNKRQGGRKPKSPTSAISGLQKIYQLTLQFVNYGEKADEWIFDAIDELEPDKVSKGLLDKLRDTRKTVSDTGDVTKTMLTHIDNNIDRVERVLEAQDEIKKTAKDNGEEDDTPKKSAKNGSSKKKNKAKAKAQAQVD